jgi:hypothetical protein
VRRRTHARRGGWHWGLVAACLALTALPVGPRQRIRERLLTLHVKLGRGFGLLEVAPPTPAERAESNRVALLENQLVRLKRLLADAGAHRDVVEQAPDTSLIPAVAYPMARAADFPQRIVLDRGRRDGVTEGLPVLSGAALVGRVALVAETSCEVQLITDPAFRLRTTIVRADGSDLEGMLTGDGSGLVCFRPQISDPRAPIPLPRAGESVVCSRQSVLCGVPAVIGSVEGVEREPGAALPQARVLPACDLNRLADLVILRGLGVEES